MDLVLRYTADIDINTPVNPVKPCEFGVLENKFVEDTQCNINIK